MFMSVRLCTPLTIYPLKSFSHTRKLSNTDKRITIVSLLEAKHNSPILEIGEQTNSGLLVSCTLFLMKNVHV